MGMEATMFLCPSKNTGEGCHFLLQGIFRILGLNLSLLCLLHCRWILYLRASLWKPKNAMVIVLCHQKPRNYLSNDKKKIIKERIEAKGTRQLKIRDKQLYTELDDNTISFFFFGYPTVACGILVPWTRIKPLPCILALEVWSLNHSTTSEVRTVQFLECL